MSKFNIIYNKEYHSSPLSFWVHHDIDSSVWEYADKYEPELPKAIVSKGFPMLIVDALGYELKFSSIQEVEHFIEVIKQKNMPTSSQLASKRLQSNGLLNSHWLSRLPAKLKPWRNKWRTGVK